MEYFVIMPDEEINNYKKLNYSHADFQNKEPFIAYSDFDQQEMFPDFFFGKNLFTYYFCVSDAMKEILAAYTAKLNGIPFFLTDENHRAQKVYWLIFPQQIDCFKDTMFPDVQNLIWDAVPDKMPFFFQTTQAKARYFVVSLEVAENLLRRRMFGIRLIRIGGENLDDKRN